ncbi:perlucin-like [Aedes albopictus]|uniref:C-type lectin domain-containing protein n=1 Tax=Aedes albopictus TaxID=7160 RepID=A0ABM1XIM8_AEDAL|nr:perlucin-like [Aedes albopictus]
MFRSGFALLLTVLCALSHGHSPGCEKPTSFYIPIMKLNWIGAVQYCNRIGMRLAVVNSESKNLAVLEAIHAANEDGIDLSNAWIGASDISKEGTFVWLATGRPVNYTNWSENNPNNDEGTENCVEIAYQPYTQFKWRWNDNKCDAVNNFVCESNF